MYQPYTKPTKTLHAQTLIVAVLMLVKLTCSKTYFVLLWGVLWSILDEIGRKSSRNDPEPHYLPQSPEFLQENPKNRRKKI